jgi:RTX calcium-binding nonapeptide repeat (4 copies)
MQAMMPRLTIALLLCLAAPAPAWAGTVDVDADCWQDGCLESAGFLAAPGERNRVLVRHDSATVVTISDAGAPLSVGDGCVALSGHRARCTSDADAIDGLDAKLWLQDGDDMAHVDSGTVYGGPGDDRLSGRHGYLVGGPGSDHLTATEQATFGDGDGAHPARDVYSGAHATVSYAGRPHGLRIDLRAGRAGEDVLRGIRSVTGTRHADTIVGTAGRDSLDGNGGRDRIVALGGGDSIRLDRGTVDAGAGNDRIVLFSGDVRARCGPGRDRIDARSGALLIGCETLRLFDLVEEHVQLHPVTTGLVVSGLRCPCTHAVYEARAGGVLVARATLGARALRLNARGRRLLAARHRLVLTVLAREVSRTFGHLSTGFRTVVTRPRP